METPILKRRSKRERPRPRDTKPSSPHRHRLPFLTEPSASLFPSGPHDLLRLLAVLAIAASVSAGCHFLVRFLNRRPEPFCDSLDASVSAGALFGQDFCEPCPANARCQDGKFECVRGYQKHGKMCIEDGVINRQAKELSELLEQHICGAHARVLCGEAGNIWVCYSFFRRLMWQGFLMNKLQRDVLIIWLIVLSI